MDGVGAEAKLTANFGLHGLRRSAASRVAMGGAGASEIMTALGHKQMATSQKYIHGANDSRKALAERAAAPALTGLGKR
jgi:integrase